jgi:Transposase DDE domain
MFTTAELFGKFHSPRAPLATVRARLARSSPNELHTLWADWFPFHWLSPTEKGPNSRERVYSMGVTFWTFLWQIFNPGSSCREAVRKVKAWFALMGRPAVQEDDSPYCQARRRLPHSTLERIRQATAQAAEQRACQAWRFHDRQVQVADGTWVSAPDTRANRKTYPCSANQKKGCGFPLIQVVALFSLTSGALLAVVLGNKHQAELQLFRKIWQTLKAGAILLADRLYCDYVTIAALQRRQVDSVLRLHHMRPRDFRRGKRLGRYDRLITWAKPVSRTRTVTRRLWKSLPPQITLRLIGYPVQIPGFRSRQIFLVTTLLGPVVYPASELASLYLRRWGIELFFREIKIALQMDVLSCKSPAMLRREITMHLIAYNLTRALMVEAASVHHQDLEQISFKGTMDTLRHYSQVIAQATNRKMEKQLINELLSALVKDPLPDRPNRVEPRARKRRPKPFPLMHEPRQALKAKLCRCHYRKN